MAFETVEYNGEKYYFTRITASLSSASANELEFANKDVDKAIASFADFLSDSIPKTPDVSYVKGIYVSSGMNKNGDVFLPTELARSFGTIRLKPIDVDHLIEEGSSFVEIVKNHPQMNFNMGKNTIIGSIYDAALMNAETGDVVSAAQASSGIAAMWDALQAADAEIIKDVKGYYDTSRFDVLMAGVLWKWLFPKTVADVTREVNDGERALSMEVYFRDYAWLMNGSVYSKEDAPHLEDAFMSRLGFNGMPVGRILRGMVFGGGGLVGHPANPAALDFIEVASNRTLVSASLQKKEEELPIVGERSDSHEKSDTGGSPMAFDQETLKEIKAMFEDVSEAKANLKLAQAENESLRTKVEALQKEVADFNESVKAAQDELQTVKEELETAKAAIAERDASLETAKTAAESKETELVALQERVTAAEAEVEAFKQADVMVKRLAALEEAKVLLDEEKDAQAVAGLTDEQFESLKNERIALREKIVASENVEDKNKEEIINETKAAENTVVFPVIDGRLETHRALAAVMNSDPELKNHYSKYAKI